MEKILKNLKGLVNWEKECNHDTSSVDWESKLGVLITADDADKIIEFIEEMNQKVYGNESEFTKVDTEHGDAIMFTYNSQDGLDEKIMDMAVNKASMRHVVGDSEPDNLMEAMLSEINRVKELITEYSNLPNGIGKMGAVLLRNDVAMAEKSIANDDVVEMLAMYHKLKQCE